MNNLIKKTPGQLLFETEEKYRDNGTPKADLTKVWSRFSAEARQRYEDLAVDFLRVVSPHLRIVLASDVIHLTSPHLPLPTP